MGSRIINFEVAAEDGERARKFYDAEPIAKRSPTPSSKADAGSFLCKNGLELSDVRWDVDWETRQIVAVRLRHHFPSCDCWWRAGRPDQLKPTRAFAKITSSPNIRCVWTLGWPRTRTI